MAIHKVLTEKKLAEELGLSPWTVRGMRLKESCPHFRVGHRVFYRLEVVLAWIAKKEAEQEARCIITPDDNYGKIRPIK